MNADQSRMLYYAVIMYSSKSRALFELLDRLTSIAAVFLFNESVKDSKRNSESCLKEHQIFHMDNFVSQSRL